MIERVGALGESASGHALQPDGRGGTLECVQAEGLHGSQHTRSRRAVLRGLHGTPGQQLGRQVVRARPLQDRPTDNGAGLVQRFGDGKGATAGSLLLTRTAGRSRHNPSPDLLDHGGGTGNAEQPRRER